jgi:hypothetical protein
VFYAGRASAQIPIDPVTLQAVAQTGYQIYNAFKGGGPGTNSLLRAQAQMLRAISQQLSVLNNKINEIWLQLDEIKKVLRDIPDEVVRTYYQDTLWSHIDNSHRLLSTFAEHLQDKGRAYALSVNQGEAANRLYDIRTARSSLLRTGSIVFTPVLCAAWYTELQLMMNVREFEKVDVRKAAEAYRVKLTELRQKLLEEIKKNEADGVQVQKDIEATSNISDYSCISNSHYRRYLSRSNSESFKWRANYHTTRRRQRPPRNPTADFREGLLALRRAGIAVSPTLIALNPKAWSSHLGVAGPRETGPFEFGSREWRAADAAYHSARRAAVEKACPNASWQSPNLADTGNAVTTRSDLLQARSLMHYSFLLCANSALASIDDVLARLPTALQLKRAIRFRN